MGYTLSTPLRSLRLRDTLAEFLQGPEGLRPFHRVLVEAPQAEELDELEASQKFWGRIKSWAEADTIYDPTTYLRVGYEELAYGHGDRRLGFNFSTSGIYSPFMWNLCRWTALQGGWKKPFRQLKQAGYYGTAHYILYDREPWPFLLPDDVPQGNQGLADGFQVDELGFRPIGVMFSLPKEYEQEDEFRVEPYVGFRAFDKILNQIARDEIARIDQAWNRCSTTSTTRR